MKLSMKKRAQSMHAGLQKFNYLENIKRIRITENRNLTQGIRMNRNERVLDFDQNLLSKIFKNVKKYDLGKYPDQGKIYK